MCTLLHNPALALAADLRVLFLGSELFYELLFIKTYPSYFWQYLPNIFNVEFVSGNVCT